MILSNIKDKIKSNKRLELPIVFVYNDCDFIPCEYIQNIKDAEIIYIQDLGEIAFNPFIDSPVIYVYKCEVLKDVTPNINNLIVITKKVDKKILPYYENYIAEVPELEDWQIKSYIQIKCKGLKQKQIDWFMTVYSKDIYKLQSELDKIAIFPTDMQSSLFEDFYNTKVFDVNKEEVTYQIALAMQNNDKDALIKLLPTVSKKEIESVYLISLLQSNMKKLIKVWFNRCPTPQNTGLKSNQIYAISKLPKLYGAEEFVELFKTVSGLDRKIVNGEFPEEYTLDYLLMKLMKN